jgi:uncharacterized phage protein (TIGR01671 family)
MAMQREIKFRAWDKRTRKMVDAGFHIIGETTAFDLLYQYGMEHKRKNEPGLLRLNSFVIMQYTGLKGKNGKEIYEGDILKFAVYNAIGKVIWDDRYFSWWIKLLHRPSDNAQDISLFDAYTSVGWEDSIEIIGNIYENSELLAQPGSSAKDGHGASREHNAPEGGLK